MLRNPTWNAEAPFWVDEKRHSEYKLEVAVMDHDSKSPEPIGYAYIEATDIFAKRNIDTWLRLGKKKLVCVCVLGQDSNQFMFMSCSLILISLGFQTTDKDITATFYSPGPDQKAAVDGGKKVTVGAADEGLGDVHLQLRLELAETVQVCHMTLGLNCSFLYASYLT